MSDWAARKKWDKGNAELIMSSSRMTPVRDLRHIDRVLLGCLDLLVNEDNKVTMQRPAVTVLSSEFSLHVQSTLDLGKFNDRQKFNICNTLVVMLPLCTAISELHYCNISI